MERHSGSLGMGFVLDIGTLGMMAFGEWVFAWIGLGLRMGLGDSCVVPGYSENGYKIGTTFQ